MASSSEYTYGDIQMNERYKRLKRNLKMSLIKEGGRGSTDNGKSDNSTWPNISSINGDNLDASSTAASLYSKIGSEVVSSSTNMKNILLHQNKFLNSNNNKNNSDNIATSSVNQSPLINDAASRALMPPPKSIGILAHSSRRNSSADIANSQMNIRLNTVEMRHDYGISSPSVYSSIRCPSSLNVQDTSQIVFEKEVMRDNMENNVAHTEKPDRIFSKWRVMLNNKSQLIIKGILECGKVARSKPVIRRLTAISVQSVFNHIYYLNGNIYDEKNELPDYIRGKFFNGFPDDWENVYQVWRNFVAGGSKWNFRWPTPITDSDDDLKSEITEITLPQRGGRRPRLRSDSMKHRSLTKISPKLSLTTDQTLRNEEALNCTQCQCSTANSIRNESINISKKVPNIVNDDCGGVSSVSSINKSQCQELNTSSAIISSHKPNINVISLKDVLPEDKINIILENLNSKNCSIEYIDKIFQMYDCFRYIMSYKSGVETEAESVKTKVGSTIKTSPKDEDTSQKNLDATFTKLRDARINICHPSNHHIATNKKLHDDYENTSKRIVNMAGGAIHKQKIRRRLTTNDFDSSDSYEDDADYNRSNKWTRRNLRSSNKRIASRMSVSNRKSNRRHMEKSDDSESDDYVPKKINPPLIAVDRELHDQMRNINAPSVTKQIAGGVDCPNNTGDMQFTLQQLSQENMKTTANHRLGRASSMSSIGGFLKNYDSSVSTTEDECKIHDNEYKKFKPNNNCGGNICDPRTHLPNQQNSRNTYQYYDSSVSITEDEFAEVNKAKNETKKKLVLQEFNAQCVQQKMKRTPIGLTHSQCTSQSYERKNLPQALSNIREVDEKSHQEFPHGKCANEIIINDNKENESMDAGENRGKKNRSFKNSRELESNEKSITEQAKPKSMSLDKKNKPTIVSIVNTSIKLNAELPTKSQAKKLENSLVEMSDVLVSAPPTIESLRPSKSLDDRKTTRNAAEDLSLTVAQLKATRKSQSLTVKLHDIKDMMKDNKVVDLKGEQIHIEKGVFGSENNPKRLTAWVPKVLQKPGSDYGLIFEGKLLNEADHVVNRKFATDFISERISLKIVKTESNEFYQLIGDLTDTKHSMPKELQKLCFNGCPSKIPQFCEKWKKLILDNSNSSGQLLNISKDIQNMPISSRGRRILPPLCYWTGERVVLKDNQAVYSPGNSQDSSMLSAEISRKDGSQNSPKRKDTSAKSTIVSTKNDSNASVKKKQNKSTENEEEEEENLNSNVLERMMSNCESRMKMAKRNSGEMENRRRSQRTTSAKRALTRKLSPHSSDSMDNDNVPSNFKRCRSKVDCTGGNLENENRRPRTQRGRSIKRSTQAPTDDPLDIKDERNHKYKRSRHQNNANDENNVANTPNARGIITYKYKKRIDRESELSDDQISTF